MGEARCADTATSPPKKKKKKKKRKLENVNDPCPNYLKFCATVRDLRPHFIEVLRTPDFRNSKAVHEIRKQMKFLMDLYKQMKSDTVPAGKSKKSKEDHSFPDIRNDEQKTLKRQQEKKKGKLLHPVHISVKSPDLPTGANNYESLDNVQMHGTYIVGGSNFGWNFIMYPSGKAIYYGVTKEPFRSKKTFPTGL